MNILVTGASGFLGSHLVKHLSSREDISLFALDRAPFEPSHSQVENVWLFGEEDPQNVLFDLKEKGMPSGASLDCVIHCAASSSFAGCEREPEETHRANVKYTEAVVSFCKATSSHLIFLSTDLVFDGSGLPPEGGFSEDMTPNPISQYAQSKVGGEAMVRELGDKGLILRICLLYGPPAGRGGGPLRWALEGVKKGKTLTAFGDEWRTPLYVGDLVQIIEDALRARLSGLYHIGGPERCNRAQFFEQLLFVFSAKDELLVETSRLAVEGPKRPEDVSLSSAKLCNDLKVRRTTLAEGIKLSVLKA